MKIALLGISANLLDTTSQEEIINYIKLNISKIGERVSLVSYVNNDYEKLLNISRENFDLIFCIGCDNSIYNHNLIENLAKIWGVRLESNQTLANKLKNYCNNKNIEFSDQEKLITEIPIGSVPICDNELYDNGFLYKHNSSLFVFLPASLQLIEKCYNSSILPLFRNKSDFNYEEIVLKCYGILEKDLRNLLEDYFINSSIEINIFSSRLDSAIHIKYLNSLTSMCQPIIAEICSKLSKFIYSTEDSSLYETAINLLKIQRKQLVIAETVTHGNISLNLSKIDDSILEESRLYNNFDAIANSLKLEPRIVGQFGRFSVNTVYELDNLLLQSSRANISIFVLGDKACDTCYIAIGDVDGIHVYKNKLQSLNSVTIQTLSETTMFYLIKKLRQNDLQFM